MAGSRRNHRNQLRVIQCSCTANPDLVSHKLHLPLRKQTCSAVTYRSSAHHNAFFQIEHVHRRLPTSTTSTFSLFSPPQPSHLPCSRRPLLAPPPVPAPQQRGVSVTTETAATVHMAHRRHHAGPAVHHRHGHHRHGEPRSRPAGRLRHVLLPSVVAAARQYPVLDPACPGCPRNHLHQSTPGRALT